MEDDFKAAYAQLNKAQKKAVDTVDGPVLVIAGPGTGKTQLLSLRVANILQQTDTDAASILCLTFTNFAATNMRDRLNKYIGPASHDVTVSTFHSFAAELMNLYPEYFWNGARLVIAPDTVQLEIIEAILSELPLDDPLALKFAGKLTAVNDAQKAMQLAKEAALTPDKLSAIVEANLAYINLIEGDLVELLEPKLSFNKLDSLAKAIADLPDQNIEDSIRPLTDLGYTIKKSFADAYEADQLIGKATNIGKWKRRWVQSTGSDKAMADERKRNEWWQALVPVYHAYRSRLHDRGYYDYADMIIEVISQLENNPDLLAAVRERYLYVMLDEFQDTNSAQFRLADLVAGYGAIDNSPNLLAVGDDDQTIFGFNGAELNNSLNFMKLYQDTKLIILEDNYRSTQEILATANGVIENADYRLVTGQSELSKNLRAATEQKKGEITHIQYPTQEHQLVDLADQVKTWWTNNPTETVAVLARNHASLRAMSHYLNEADVPISYEQQNNVFEQPLVQQLIILSRLVYSISEGDKPGVNFGLCQLLRHPVWGIEPDKLWQMALDNRKKPDWLSSLKKQDKSLHDWLLRLAADSTSEQLVVMIDRMLGLTTDGNYRSPLNAYFIKLKHIDNTYLEGISGIARLLSEVREFTVGKNRRFAMNDFIDFVDLHESLDRPVTDESWFMSGKNAVQLMTVHKAKGLEFDKVVLLDGVEGNWKPRHIGRKPPANLPLQPNGETYDDYVRLLYVAVTRARSTFVVGSFQYDNSGTEIIATPLISHLKSLLHTSRAADESLTVLQKSLSWPRLTSKDEKSLLTPGLEGYQLSVTALLQFLDVSEGGPRQFLERQMLRLPTASTTNMAYGTALHRALQIAQLSTNTGKYKLANVLKEYEQTLLEQQLIESEYHKYLAHGKQVITNLMGRSDFKLIKGDQPETKIRQINLDGALIGGDFDHIHQSQDELIITDYKTGKPVASFATKDKTKAYKAWRHRTQLVFYHILASKSPRFANVKTITTQMLYVEAEPGQNLRLPYTPDNDIIDRQAKLINAVWKKINTLEFVDTSSYSADYDGVVSFEDDLINGKI